MNLRTYTSALPHGGMAAFAKELGITPIYLSQLAGGQDGRVPSVRLCSLIEEKSGMQVRRWDLRPADWYLMWPDLIGKKGAPAVPATESAKG